MRLYMQVNVGNAVHNFNTQGWKLCRWHNTEYGNPYSAYIIVDLENQSVKSLMCVSDLVGLASYMKLLLKCSKKQAMCWTVLSFNDLVSF